jgi:hypothetical protein
MIHGHSDVPNNTFRLDLLTTITLVAAHLYSAIDEITPAAAAALAVEIQQASFDAVKKAKALSARKAT